MKILPVVYKDMEHVKRVAEKFPSMSVLPNRIVKHIWKHRVITSFDVYKLTFVNKDGLIETLLIFECPNFEWKNMEVILKQITASCFTWLPYNKNLTSMICSSGSEEDERCIINMINRT